MRLFEDPDEPFAGTNIDEKPHYDDSDAYNWIIRKKGLYLLSLTTDNYHDSLSSTIREWIYHQYSKKQIALDAEDENIMIVGDYKSYEDFDVPLVDNLNMGLLTGRYWSSSNIISSWDNDQAFIKYMPLVVDMLKKSFKFPNQKILSTYVDLHIYDENSDIESYDQIKQIKDVFKYKAPKQTQDQKDKIQQRIQMHIQADPEKRKMLQKQFGLNSDLSYKFGIPPTIRKYLKNDPSFLNKINWSKWGLNRNDVLVNLVNEIGNQPEQKVSNQKLYSYRKPFPIPEKYKEVLRREPGLINRVDWSKFGMTKQQAIQKILFEDADHVNLNGKSLNVGDSDAIAFGYVDGLVFYKKGSNSNHQQIYYELKARLSPNYPKMAKALQTNNLPAVNHFLKQIVAYLNNRGINVVGDMTGFPKLLKDLYTNDIESLDITNIINNLEPEQFEKLQNNAYRIRKEVFVVSGRAWTKAKIVSFWNSVNQAKRCVKVFDLIDDVKQYRFEFIDDVGTFYTYDEIRSGSVKKGKVGDMSVIHGEPDPYKRRALRKKLFPQTDDEYWADKTSLYKKKGSLTPWEREKVKNLAENVNDVFDNKGIGSTPNQIDIDYFGFVRPMKPSTFRSLVPPGVSGTETTEKIIIPAIKQGKKIAPPFLLVRWDDTNKVWRTIDHEGRSRTDAISKLFGDNVEMPVHILPMGLRARNITGDMKSALIIPQK